MKDVSGKAGTNLSAASFHHYYPTDPIERSWENLIDPKVLDSLGSNIQAVKDVINMAGENYSEFGRFEEAG